MADREVVGGAPVGIDPAEFLGIKRRVIRSLPSCRRVGFGAKRYGYLLVGGPAVR